VKPAKATRKLEAVPDSDVSAPEHLSAESRAWVESIRQGWTVDAHHERMLLVAAQAWDLSEQMREVLEAEGYTYYVQRLGAYRPRPEAQIMHDAQLRLLRALRDLGLDDAPIPSGPLALRHGNKRR
jgi:phage terminase small subunit